LTKTDDILLELSRTLDAYLQSFFLFQYENKTYRLVNNYMRCDACGNHPIIEVSIIQSSDGLQLRVGNDCIDRITNRRVSEWFNDYRRKRQNVINNREYINGLSSILKAYERNELPFQTSNGDVVKLREMFELLCNGLNPTRKQEQIAECYLSRKTNI
jgi:hypothetical protein